MEVEQYKLQYLVDWELIIPIQRNPAEKEVVSTFLESKHVGYTIEGHYSNKSIICKNIN